MSGIGARQVTVVREVRASKMIMFDYTSSLDAYEVLASQFSAGDADAIINLSVQVKITPFDYILTLVTLGIANARTREVTGKLPCGATLRGASRHATGSSTRISGSPRRGAPLRYTGSIREIDAAPGPELIVSGEPPAVFWTPSRPSHPQAAKSRVSRP